MVVNRLNRHIPIWFVINYGVREKCLLHAWKKTPETLLDNQIILIREFSMTVLFRYMKLLSKLRKIQNHVVRNVMQMIFSDSSDFTVSTTGSQYLDQDFIQLKPFRIFYQIPFVIHWAFKYWKTALIASASLTWVYFVKSCSLHPLHQQPTKITKARQTLSPQRGLMDTIYIEIYRKMSILYMAKKFHSFPPFLLFHCCFVLKWLFILARGHSNSVRWRVRYLFCSYQSGDEEHRSRRCHRRFAGLSFGSSVALGVMWLLPSWLKMNQ